MEEIVKKVGFEKYPAYKDSGVEWLGKVPEQWKITRGNYVFRIINERSKNGTETLLSVSEHHGVKPRSESKVNTFMAESYEGYKLCYPGDLVINSLWAWSRGLGFSKHTGIVSTAYSVYRPDEKSYDADYLNYLLRIDSYVAQYLIASRGIWISRLLLSDWSFLRLFVLSPSLTEQNAIANFLNTKTSQIEKVIEQKEKQIELLKERRQILIHKSITQGLNADVSRRGSGVQWIGEIPEHWTVKRLSMFGTFSKGGGISRAELVEEGLPAILYGDIYTKYDTYVDEVFHRISKETAKKAIEIEQGDLLFTGSGETIEDIGKCVLYTGGRIAYAGGDVIIFKASTNNHLFLSFALNSNGVRYEKARFSKGEIIVHTYSSKLKNIYIPIPPINEQDKIVEFLLNNKKTTATAISCKQKEIEKLKEYKATLINSAVTGKIKVA